MNAELTPGKSIIASIEAYEEAESRGKQAGRTFGILTPAPQVQAQAAEPDRDVTLNIRSLHYGHSLDLRVPKTSTAREVKVAMALALGRSEAEVFDGKLLKANQTGGYTSLKDNEVTGTRSRLFVMGIDLTALPGAPASQPLAPVAPKAKPRPKKVIKAVEKIEPELVLLTISHATSREGPVELQILNT